jgi:hypothetical protein
MLFESLLSILKDVEDQDSLVDGYTMNPTKQGYKVLHNKKEVCSVSFVNKNKEFYDMETAQDNPNDYNIYITEIKQEDKIKSYIKKLTDLGFVNISQE